MVSWRVTSNSVNGTVVDNGENGLRLAMLEFWCGSRMMFGAPQRLPTLPRATDLVTPRPLWETTEWCFLVEPLVIQAPANAKENWNFWTFGIQILRIESHFCVDFLLCHPLWT